MGSQDSDLNKKASIGKCYKEKEAGESYDLPCTGGTQHTK